MADLSDEIMDEVGLKRIEVTAESGWFDLDTTDFKPIVIIKSVYLPFRHTIVLNEN